MNVSKTAILIFANSAKYEASKKRFYKAELLFDELNASIENKVQQTKIPYFIITEKEQIGTKFGQRFSNAIQSIFDKGYDSIITLGNDTPHIQPKDIIEAYQNLASNKTTIGASHDGGFYLLGISKTNFDQLNFQDLPWQTSSLFGTITKNFLAKNIQFSRLKSLIDIDNLRDAEKVLHHSHFISKVLKLILISVFYIDSKINFHLFSFKNDIYRLYYYNKGSPCYN
ncbi:TIGR04282 family arsenosugar biosynthesis glycosyltransferase [Frigoriflavimonas asaccharolytica]|nr:DUF2064 domain-containing protein [Frigoriflavimonas asaccharolytica]